MKFIKITEKKESTFKVEVDVEIIVGNNERTFTRKAIVELPIEDLSVVENILADESVNS